MKYKVRLNCHSFVDTVVEAKNKEEAISEAHRVTKDCPQNGFDFGEFLDIEDGDEIEN